MLTGTDPIPCKSGKHYWTRQEDAEKCCNGWKRILKINGASILLDGTFGMSYYYEWVKQEAENE